MLIILYEFSKENLLGFNNFFLCTGRGCPVNCSICGGSNISQQIINKRSNFLFRSHKSVLSTIQDAVKAGIERLYICFDPTPDKQYYIDLFKKIRMKKINISLGFECWSIPSYKFLNEFERTFGKAKYSKIVL